MKELDEEEVNKSNILEEDQKKFSRQEELIEDENKKKQPTDQDESNQQAEISLPNFHSFSDLVGFSETFELSRLLFFKFF